MTATPDSPPARLLSARHLPFVVAAVALVTLGAYENRATITVLPVVARDLHGMALFGAASAVPSATFLVGAALAGALADRRGPRVPVALGIGGFVVAAFAVALAPSMPVLLLGRAVGGFGEAMLDVGLSVLIARALPTELRARMFSLFATAWIVPSLVGPGVAGAINDHLGWRAVFALGGLAALPVVPALVPALRRTADSQVVPDGPALRTTVLASLAAAVGVTAISLAGPELHGSTLHRLLAAGSVLAGLAVTLAAAPTLLPSGTLRARCGAASVVALRGLVAAAFGLLGAFLPLILQATRGMSPAASGVTLGVTGLCWAIGSNLASRNWSQVRLSAAQRVRIGLGCIVIGGIGVLAFVTGIGSYTLLLGFWSVAGIGMGVTSNSLSTALLELAPAESLGLHQSAASTTGVVAQGLSAAGAGAAIALTAGGHDAFVGIVAAGIAIALVALVLTPRMDRDCATPESPRDRVALLGV